MTSRPHETSSAEVRAAGRAAALGLLLSSLIAASGPVAGPVVASPELEAAFSAHYEALSGYAPEDLKLELAETIEDALTSGGHLTRASLDYKVRQIESALLDRLRAGLCSPSAPPASDLDALRAVAVESTAAAGEDAAVSFAPQDLGMIAGVAVRLAQGMPRAQLCGG
jgi:hypothetical protein